MPRFLIAKILIILTFLVIFGYGVAALRSGTISSRGYKFHREENPIGYWFTVLVHLLGPAAIIYILLTR